MFPGPAATKSVVVLAFAQMIFLINRPDAKSPHQIFLRCAACRSPTHRSDPPREQRPPGRLMAGMRSPGRDERGAGSMANTRRHPPSGCSGAPGRGRDPKRFFPRARPPLVTAAGVRKHRSDRLLLIRHPDASTAHITARTPNNCVATTSNTATTTIKQRITTPI